MEEKRNQRLKEEKVKHSMGGMIAKGSICVWVGRCFQVRDGGEWDADVLVGPDSQERHESTVRKTLEKSRKARQSQNIQGRKATQNSKRTHGFASYLSFSCFCLDDNRLLPSVELLIFCFCHNHNFLLINVLAPRRPPPTPWEKNLVSRLLTPTFSYLARSKSAGCQSGEEGTLVPMITPPHQPEPLIVVALATF